MPEEPVGMVILEIGGAGIILDRGVENSG